MTVVYLPGQLIFQSLSLFDDSRSKCRAWYIRRKQRSCCIACLKIITSHLLYVDHGFATFPYQHLQHSYHLLCSLPRVAKCGKHTVLQLLTGSTQGVRVSDIKSHLPVLCRSSAGCKDADRYLLQSELSLPFNTAVIDVSVVWKVFVKLMWTFHMGMFRVSVLVQV